MEREKLENDLRESKNKFEIRINGYVDQLHNFENFTEYGKYKSYVKEIENFENILFIAQKDMFEIIDHEQKLLGYSSSFD